jgi:cell division protein FtsW (lipid II flippase)
VINIRREQSLLLLATLFVGVTQVALIVARGGGWGDGWRAAVWLLCAVVGHLVLNRLLPHRDPLVFPVTMFVAGWGLLIIARLEPFFANRQAIWLVISTAALVAVCAAPRHLHWLRRYRYVWLFSGLLLLSLTILFGSNPSGFGPRLWLGAADVFVQPSEILKLLLVVFLASYIADRHPVRSIHLGRVNLPSPGFFAPMLLMWGLSVVILLWQRDLGTATLFFVVFVVMLYLASGNALYLVGGLLMLLVVAGYAYQSIDVVRTRIDIWADPWRDPQGRAFQIVQSLLAFAAGGIGGQGIGQGSPSYIPVVHSDFVFAALAEEWGLIGTLAVVCCVALLVMRAMRLALLHHARPFQSLLAAGIGVTLATQSLLIAGGTLKLIPLTGVTLPLLSYGGSSLLITCVMIGLLLCLSEVK